MERGVDLAYWHYLFATVLLGYNLIIYLAWNYVSKSYKDKRFRPVCLNVIFLILAFMYVFSWNLYVRHFRYTDFEKYNAILESQFWQWKMLPVLLLFFLSTVRLTRWVVVTIKLYYRRKQVGKKFEQRQFNNNVQKGSKK